MTMRFASRARSASTSDSEVVVAGLPLARAMRSLMDCSSATLKVETAVQWKTMSFTPQSASSRADGSTPSAMPSRSRSELPLSLRRVAWSDTPSGSMAWNCGSAARLLDGSSIPRRARVP